MGDIYKNFEIFIIYQWFRVTKNTRVFYQKESGQLNLFLQLSLRKINKLTMVVTREA